MKRFALFLLAVVLLFSACRPAHKASGQRKKADVLHAYGTDILTADGAPLSLRAESVSLSEDSQDALQKIDAAFRTDDNAVRLRLDGTLLVDDAALSDSGKALLAHALELAEKERKYLLLGLFDFAKEYDLWNSTGEEAGSIAAAYGDAASQCAGQKFFGGYEIGTASFPADEGKKTALDGYQKFLQTVARAIRAVDADHMLILRRMPRTLFNDEYGGYPVIKDANFMIAADMEAIEFYRNAPAENAAPHLRYPNGYLLKLQNSRSLEDVTGKSISTDIITEQTVTGDVFYADTEKGNLCASIGMNVLPTDATAGGELRVMSLKLEKCDKDGGSAEPVYQLDSTKDVKFFYQAANGDSGESSAYDDGSAYLESIDDQVTFTVKDLSVPLEGGAYYKLTVTAKQRGMRQGYECTPLISVRTYDSATHFDREGLAALAADRFTYAKDIGVPILFTDIMPQDAASKQQFCDDLTAAIADLGQSFAK